MLSSDHMYAMRVYTHEHTHIPHKCLNYKSVRYIFKISQSITKPKHVVPDRKDGSQMMVSYVKTWGIRLKWYMQENAYP